MGKEELTIFQILILILGIIAVSYVVGNEVKFVSATVPEPPKDTEVVKQSGDKKPDLSNTPSLTGLPAAKIIGGSGVGESYVLKKSIEYTSEGTTYDIPAISKSGEKYFFNNNGKIQEIPKDELIKNEVLKSDGAINSDAIKSSPGSSTLSRFFGADKGRYADSILTGFQWAAGTYLLIKTVGSLLSIDKQKVDALAVSASAGMFVGQGINTGLQKGGWIAESGAKKYLTFGNKLNAGQASFAWGLLVTAIIFYMSYKTKSTEKVTFTCNPWDAPVGGNYCEKCNEGTLPCSEYQCRSLGQACELVNPGTEESKCVWVNRKDVSFPVITLWQDALTNGYKYSSDNTISPPDRGVKIIRQDSTSGCARAFESLSFGIITDEPSKCKIDYLRKEKFDNMSFYFGASSTFKYNHTQVMVLPGPNTSENGSVVFQNDGNYELFVRCQDANGNYNTGNFVFKYCVEKGPDTTPTLIVTTNLLNNMPVAYNQTEIDLEVYVNEPSECKWSRLDQSFGDMKGGMSCASSVFEMNAQMLYKCKTKLTGLKNSEENKFYFRCKDQPGKPENERNLNLESYKFNLVGTQPLVLSSLGPNGTIKGSTDSVKVALTARTDAGYKEGASNCYYSNTGVENSYIMFYNTNSYEHSQDLYLGSGNYDYWIKCIDLGGNPVTGKVTFKTESDRGAPSIVRTYHEESYLKLVTNEQAECVYDSVNCNYLFSDGKKISSVDGMGHFVNWDTKTNLYVKCKDTYGNQPAPNECSITVRAFNVKF